MATKIKPEPERAEEVEALGRAFLRQVRRRLAAAKHGFVLLPRRWVAEPYRLSSQT